MHTPGIHVLAEQHGWQQVALERVDLSVIGDPLDTEILDGFEKSGVTVLFGRTDGHFGLVTFDKAWGADSKLIEWDWQTYHREAGAVAGLESILTGAKTVDEVVGYAST